MTFFPMTELLINSRSQVQKKRKITRKITEAEMNVTRAIYIKKKVNKHLITALLSFITLQD